MSTRARMQDASALGVGARVRVTDASSSFAGEEGEIAWLNAEQYYVPMQRDLLNADGMVAARGFRADQLTLIFASGCRASLASGTQAPNQSVYSTSWGFQSAGVNCGCLLLRI